MNMDECCFVIEQVTSFLSKKVPAQHNPRDDHRPD
jgi:hypothetical protein